MEEVKCLLVNKADIVNKTLNEILDIKEPVSDTLLESMGYSLFAGGKRIRPILTIMTAEMIDGNEYIARKVGAAIELIHTYSLIHDDLPSMDNDDYRRGKPTNHKVYGPGMAVLTGDALLTHAFNVLSTLDFSSEKLIKIIELVSNGSGLNGMVGGQALDLKGEDQKELSVEELNKIHINKTAALFRASILSGAYCGDPDPFEIESLKEFSYNLGILFQIIDDILDVEGDEKKLGKSTGKDEELNKSTYPDIIGLKASKKRAQKYAEESKASLNIFGEKADELKQLVDFVLKRQY